VSFGLRRAVSNSSAENSSEIFKSGLNSCNNKNTIKIQAFQHKTKNNTTQMKKNHILKLTFKKLSTEANSHIDRSFHRGNCDSDGGSINGVTILLHCDGGEGEDSGESSLSLSLTRSRCRRCSFLGFRSITGGDEYRRWAARIVHARDGRLLLVVGGGGAVAVSSLGTASSTAVVGFWESGSGEGGDRSAGSGEGDPWDMMGWEEGLGKLWWDHM